MKAEVGKLYMHIKTCGIYKVISLGKIEATMTPCVVYEDDHGAWVRPYDEFCDGRFTEIVAAHKPHNHYGFCPTCGAPGRTRERRPNGNDTCENGHSYPSAKSVTAPVDRSARELVSGAPVPDDDSHTALKPNGQQKDYVVLSEAERAKGFVRPVRRSYVHQKCGHATSMSQALAETYARDPGFYSGTYCAGCGAHFPVGEAGEFVWENGSKVGT